MAMIKKTAPCRGCGKEITFIKTVKGKTMPVDVEPVWVLQNPGGSPYLRPDGTYVTGRIVGDAYDTEDPDSNLIRAYVSHFATCPVANKFRNERKGG